MGTNLKNIIITQPNGNRVPMQNRRTATGVVSAKQNWGLNAEDTVDITVESPFPQTYNIGDRITIFGRDYKLNRLPSVKKTGMHEFQYTLQFEGVQYDLFRVTYDLTIDTTMNELQDIQGDSLTGNLRRFMTVLVANANRVFPGKWKLGVCPDTIGDKTLTFGESDNCLSVLQNLCSQSNFNVEFDIVQADGIYTINLYERVGQTLPYKFEYGKGRGLYDLHRENVSSANIVTRLKVYGSTENITSKYRADRLCLPGRTKGQSYIEKAKMVAKYGIFEGRKNFDNVKPTFTGSIESKVDEFSFIDTKFPFDLNAKNADGKPLYRINGVSAKIHFNTGNLAGYDFEVKSYDHATHKFTLIKTTDDRGDEFPSETSAAFQFGLGDEYKVLDIAYSPEIEAQAEAELAEVGNKYYDQNCQPKVQYGLSVTKAYLEKIVGTPDSITNVFAPGDYLHVVDKDIDVDKAIRIKSFVRNILDPYEYTLTISDTVTSATITNRVISDLVELDKIVTINNLKDPTRARANWRSSREVLNMVFDPDGDYYTDKIKPNSIDTMALSVGAKSMQFGLMNTVFQPNFQGNNNVVKWQGGVLTHYTINEETAVSWVLADGQLTLDNDSDAYYIYAKCERGGQAGAIVFTKERHKVNEDANYYYFWIGILNSVDSELKARPIALTYGFTMVNGRFIKTGKIASAGGETYFDLDNSEIGGNIKFLAANGQYKDVKDLSFLSATFGDLSTEISGGAVLSGLLGVKDERGNIQAALCGINPTEEDEAPLIFAGAQATNVCNLYAWQSSGESSIVYTEQRSPSVGDILFDRKKEILGYVSEWNNLSLQPLKASWGTRYGRYTSQDTCVEETSLLNVNNANFRVYKNGKCVARDFELGGWITKYIQEYARDQKLDLTRGCFFVIFGDGTGSIELPSGVENGKNCILLNMSEYILPVHYESLITMNTFSLQSKKFVEFVNITTNGTSTNWFVKNTTNE